MGASISCGSKGGGKSRSSYSGRTNRRTSGDNSVNGGSGQQHQLDARRSKSRWNCGSSNGGSI